ncbi:MAG: fused MFS/spermidine synthase [Methylococcaceae bacterium]|nr:fused MFS/spermidine synthase [Methylococcaceae bacterium]
MLLSAFLSGMVIMAVELTATQLMAPFFGTSVFVWTNLLGVVMTALALGYWLGGKLGDHYPSKEWLFTLLLSASFLLALIPVIAPWMLQAISASIEEDLVSLVVNSLLGSIVLFAVPFMVLGMISPSIVRLLSSGIEASGSVAGLVFSASTIGSILGTFLPTLLFVPWIGCKRTIFLFAGILLLLSLIGLRKAILWLFAAIFIFLVYRVPGTLFNQADIVYQTESLYGHVWVIRDGRGFYRLKRDQKYGVQSVYHPQKVLTDGVWDYFIVAPLFQPWKKHQSITIIGSAGGTAYRVWQETLGDRFHFQFEGAEIDPAVVSMACRYFGLNYPNLRINTSDGRRYLVQSRTRFDVVLLDAYHNLYIPPHLTSLEFFRLVESRLNPDGVTLANVHSWLSTSEVVDRMIRTLGEVFHKVWIINVSRTNFLLVATNGRGDLFEAIGAIPPTLHDLAGRIKTRSHRLTELPEAALITDDRPLSAVVFDRAAVERWAVLP